MADLSSTAPDELPEKPRKPPEMPHWTVVAGAMAGVGVFCITVAKILGWLP